MGSDNTATVRAGFDALARGGVDAMLETVHPDFEMHTPPDFAAEPGTYSGHDGVRRWFDEFYEVMERVDLVAHEIEPAGEQVVVSLEIQTRGRLTGLELSQPVALLCTLRDDKLVRMEFFRTREEALEAAAAA